MNPFFWAREQYIIFLSFCKASARVARLATKTASVWKGLMVSCNVDVVVVVLTCFLATGCPCSSWRAESDQTGVRQEAGGVGLGGPAGRRKQLGGITVNFR